MSKGNLSTKYRGFIKASISPEDIKNTEENIIVIYIPEPITYDSKSDLFNSNTRWDCSFGIEKEEVVILLRHITVIDKDYAEVRKIPEFCYDYDTFKKLSGRIEIIAKKRDIEGQLSEVEINEYDSENGFNGLYPSLLVGDKNAQINITPFPELLAKKCTDEYIKIPTPFRHIISNSVSTGNYNCNRPLVDDSFFEALAYIDAGKLENEYCHITKDYVSLNNTMYDSRIKRVLSDDEWSKICFNYTVKEKQNKKRALEKHNLLDAYNALENFLQSHDCIRKIYQDASKDWQAPHKIIKADLKYGYKLDGFIQLKDSVIWRISAYERAIKENTYLCGRDEYLLMYKNGEIVEVVTELDYRLYKGEHNLSDDEYERYSENYVKI